mgnify:CR=1 FL=1
MKTSLKNTLLIMAAQMTTLTVLAQAPKAPAKPAIIVPVAQPTQPRSSDKVDLKKLEDKYWSAKDEDYAVIQNRTFSKAGKFYLSAMYGTLVNDPFAQSKPFGASFGYYFNEDFGIEGSYILNSSKSSDSVNEFQSTVANTRPNYNLPGNAMTLGLTYTPFYAKMAFMNMAIMYFDMGFSAGFGLSEYDQVVQDKDSMGIAIIGQDTKVHQTAAHFELGVMQQLFISKNFAFRLDIKNSFYSEKIAPYYVGSSTQGETTKLKNNTLIMFGLTLFTN